MPVGAKRHILLPTDQHKIVPQEEREHMNQALQGSSGSELQPGVLEGFAVHPGGGRPGAM